MKQHNLYEPIYVPKKYNPHSVEVRLLNIQKVEYWEIVQNYLQDKQFITNSQARSIT